jgi:hypothetical protein
MEHYIGLARAINHGGGLDAKAWAVAVPVARPSLPLSPNRHARPGPSRPEALAQAPPARNADERSTSVSGLSGFAAFGDAHPSAAPKCGCVSLNKKILVVV